MGSSPTHPRIKNGIIKEGKAGRPLDIITALPQPEDSESIH
jgi:hypothetical protein